jgi:hypothetical protein
MPISWRRFGRGSGMTGAIELVSSQSLRERHLLLVPSTVTQEDVGELVRARVQGSNLAAHGEVKLGRHSRLTGPYEMTMEDAVDAAVPMPWTVAYAFHAPVEREDPPLPDVDDRDGFAFAFPHGLPWREEGRGLRLLVALARRVQGAVRVAGGDLVQPDPDRAVDILVHSPQWLEPETVLGLVQRVLPGAHLAVEGEEWEGPAPEVYSGAVILRETAHDPLKPGELAALHAVADDHDLARLRSEDVLDAFAVVADVGPFAQDGAVEVLVHVTEPGEPAVADQEWGSHPFVTYEIRWSCPEPEERERRLPSASYLASRERVRPLITAVAAVVVEAAAGVIVDEDGFWLDRYQL